MSKLDSKPRLRWPLDVQHAEHGGEQIVILSDPQLVAPEPAVLPAALLPVISRFDGERSIEAIVEEGRSYGVTAELVVGLSEELERLHLLETPGAKKRWEAIKRNFAESSFREAALAGGVYPENPTELRRQLNAFIDKARKQPGNRAGRFIKRNDENVVGVVCPHIDYARGWESYASTYDVLSQIEPPDVVFLLGTSHQPGSTFFQLTNKDFQTPIGTFPAATEVVDTIVGRFGRERSLKDEILHRREHSLELQLPFMAHCYSDSELPTLVPILVGSFYDLLLSNTRPSENGEIDEFIDICAEIAKELIVSGKRVLFYAGIDLAHVGRAFGDSRVMSDPQTLSEIERRDRALLDAVLSFDDEALFTHIHEDRDARRVCGFPSLAVMIPIMSRAGLQPKGHLVDYRQAVNKSSDCVVTFSSACWTQ